MIADIERGESEKNIYEKYGNSYPARIIEAVLAITAITIGLKLATNGMDSIKESISYRKYEKEAKLKDERKNHPEKAVVMEEVTNITLLFIYKNHKICYNMH